MHRVRVVCVTYVHVRYSGSILTYFTNIVLRTVMVRGLIIQGYSVLHTTRTYAFP